MRMNRYVVTNADSKFPSVTSNFLSVELKDCWSTVSILISSFIMV